MSSWDSYTGIALPLVDMQVTESTGRILTYGPQRLPKFSPYLSVDGRVEYQSTVKCCRHFLWLVANQTSGNECSAINVPYGATWVLTPSSNDLL